MKKPLKQLLARIEVKSVKFHRGHDGMQGLNCKLYVDGKFVAHVHDDARGGCFDYEQCIGQDKDGMPTMTKFKMREFLDKAKEEYDLRYTIDLGDDPWDTTHDWDSLVNEKVEEYTLLKTFKRDAKKGVLYKTAKGIGYRGFKDTIPNCFKKYGKARMLKEFQRIYDTAIGEGKDVMNTDYLQSVGVIV